MFGYRAAQDPDEPADVPTPLGVRLALDSAGAALDAYARQTSSRRRYALTNLLVGVPFVLATTRVARIASRRRAIRMGLLRRTDAPPPRIPLAQVAMAWAIAFARRRDAKRRGAWPPSFATLAGARFGLAIENERRWRSDLREWRANYQR